MRRRAYVVVIAHLCAILYFIGAPTASADVRPFGTVTTASAPRTCPSGYSCSGVTVTCPGLQLPGLAHIAFEPAAAPVRGFLVAFSGSIGDEWYNSDARTEAMLANLRANGISTALVAWPNGWMFTLEGERAGVAVNACRPATITRYLYDTMYVPLGLTKVHGVCGFCMTGSSGGATQVAYSVVYYDLGSVVDVAIPTGGPVIDNIVSGCFGTPPGQEFTPQVKKIDAAWGYLGNNEGPCEYKDTTYTDLFAADSISNTTTPFPNTRWAFVLGTADDRRNLAQVRTFEARLIANGCAMVSEDAVKSGHAVHTNSLGIAAITAAVLAQPSATTTAPCTTTSTASTDTSTTDTSTTLTSTSDTSTTSSTTTSSTTTTTTAPTTTTTTGRTTTTRSRTSTTVWGN